MTKKGPVAASVVEAQRRPYGISSAGMALSAALHAVLIAVAITTAHRAMMEKEEERKRQEELQPPAPEPFSWMPARLLKLGNAEPTETAMPQREVPALPTAPPEPEVNPQLASNPDSTTPGPRRVRSNPMDLDPRHIPNRPRRAAPDEDVNLVWDRLRQDFPEKGGFSHVPGFPDGDPNGTELDRSRASPGDWYRRQLEDFFRDRWVVPSMIPRRELSRLSCKVRLAVDATFRIVDYELTKTGGTPLCAAGVEGVRRRLRLERTPLPAIPTAIRDYAVANGFEMTWRDLPQ